MVNGATTLYVEFPYSQWKKDVNKNFIYSKADIYSVAYDKESYTYKQELEVEFTRVHFGYDPQLPQFGVMSFIFEKEDTQKLFVGDEVYEFSFHEPILHHYCPLGNSRVVHPFAETKNYFIIFMGNEVQPIKKASINKNELQKPLLTSDLANHKLYDNYLDITVSKKSEIRTPLKDIIFLL